MSWVLVFKYLGLNNSLSIFNGLMLVIGLRKLRKMGLIFHQYYFKFNVSFLYFMKTLNFCNFIKMGLNFCNFIFPPISRKNITEKKNMKTKTKIKIKRKVLQKKKRLYFVNHPPIHDRST